MLGKQLMRLGRNSRLEVTFGLLRSAGSEYTVNDSMH